MCVAYTITVYLCTTLTPNTQLGQHMLVPPPSSLHSTATSTTSAFSVRTPPPEHKKYKPEEKRTSTTTKPSNKTPRIVAEVKYHPTHLYGVTCYSTQQPRTQFYTPAQVSGIGIRRKHNRFIRVIAHGFQNSLLECYIFLFNIVHLHE